MEREEDDEEGGREREEDDEEGRKEEKEGRNEGTERESRRKEEREMTREKMNGYGIEKARALEILETY